MASKNWLQKLFETSADKERETEDKRRRVAYLKRKYSKTTMEDTFEESPKRSKR